MSLMKNRRDRVNSLKLKENNLSPTSFLYAFITMGFFVTLIYLVMIINFIPSNLLITDVVLLLAVAVVFSFAYLVVIVVPSLLNYWVLDLLVGKVLKLKCLNGIKKKVGKVEALGEVICSIILFIIIIMILVFFDIQPSPVPFYFLVIFFGGAVLFIFIKGDTKKKPPVQYAIFFPILFPLFLPLLVIFSDLGRSLGVANSFISYPFKQLGINQKVSKIIISDKALVDGLEFCKKEEACVIKDVEILWHGIGDTSLIEISSGYQKLRITFPRDKIRILNKK